MDSSSNPNPEAPSAPSTTIPHLRDALTDLTAHPYPVVPNPPELNNKKRASVALIIRIQPHYAHWPTADFVQERSQQPPKSPEQRLTEFFDQDWVQHGDPEILYIKRTTRLGDKWAGHIAFPGGRRDPEDADDQAAAVRETWEEVGLELSNSICIPTGNLPQRVVSARWGRLPLMVLCPYVFLITSPDLPPLRLQPTEVASAHFVSIRALSSPALRTYEYQDVSGRLWGNAGVSRWMIRNILGDMIFAAIRLHPSESIHCNSIDGFIPEGPPQHELSLFGKMSTWWHSKTTAQKALAEQKNLHLWGLTLGITADFLDLLPPHNSLRLWIYPTFTPWDVQLWIRLWTYMFRRQRRAELTKGYHQASLASDAESTADLAPGALPTSVQGEGLGVSRYYARAIQEKTGTRSMAIDGWIGGYYSLLQKGMATALLTRFGVVVVVVFVASKKYRNTFR
ncbi:hypothetical protein K402DRAFT_389577 [Aulographum hederae CBS 113979]|uniref:Nudix hydrolase domain-containing protein n=1 Tax=Aulographum hederae CBS 113979 TaxID=1176131 RepID=A0A6G1HC61_9PEZI|nr:hypothetical protein K402DRAFT_389577 [Aulographum hederae CBS 113979]